MTREAIEVPLVNEQTALIVVDKSIGAFAIHQRVYGGAAVGPGWSVSHRTTGMLIWTTKEQYEAVQVAVWLHDQQIIPMGRDETLVWKSKLGAKAHAALTAQLAAVAPRYIPPGY